MGGTTALALCIPRTLLQLWGAQGGVKARNCCFTICQHRGRFLVLGGRTMNQWFLCLIHNLLSHPESCTLSAKLGCIDGSTISCLMPSTSPGLSKEVAEPLFVPSSTGFIEFMWWEQCFLKQKVPGVLGAR